MADSIQRLVGPGWHQSYQPPPVAPGGIDCSIAEPARPIDPDGGRVVQFTAMRCRAAALVLSGLVGAAAIGASLVAVQGPGVSPVKDVASFKVTVLHPLLPTDPKTDRVALDITNTGGVAGWPKCKVVATASGPHRGAISYWSPSKVPPGQTVHTDVRLTIVNGGVRFLAYPDVAARCHAAIGPAPPSSPKPKVVVPAVVPATLPPAQVANLQMFTGEVGIGIGGIEEPTDLPGPAYLIVTSDGGVTWSVTGTLPLRLSALDLVTVDLAFENQRAGYLEMYDRAAHRDIVYFTSDGGGRWTTVSMTGDPTSISVDGASLWVVTFVCTKPTQSPGDCPSRLLTYRFGTLGPASVVSVPVEPPAAFPEATLLRRLGTTAGIFKVGGTTPGHHALVLTTDAGQSWRPIGNPCTTMSVDGLVVLGPGHWLLHCQQAGGMSNYSVRLYGTEDGGASWRLLAEHNVTQSLPDIGDPASGGTFTISGNGQTLWVHNPVAGLSSSRDGGLDWKLAVTIATAPARLATAGTSDAWLAVPWKGLYFTTNATTWRLLGP